MTVKTWMYAVLEAVQAEMRADPASAGLGSGSGSGSGGSGLGLGSSPGGSKSGSSRASLHSKAVVIDQIGRAHV